MLKLSEVKKVVSDNYLVNFSEFVLDAYYKNRYSLYYRKAKNYEESNEQALMKLFKIFSPDIFIANITIIPFPGSYSITYVDEITDSGLFILKSSHNYKNTNFQTYSVLSYNGPITPNEKELKSLFDNVLLGSYEKGEDFSLLTIGMSEKDVPFEVIYEKIIEVGKSEGFNFEDVSRISGIDDNYYVTVTKRKEDFVLNIIYKFDMVLDEYEILSLSTEGKK